VERMWQENSNVVCQWLATGQWFSPGAPVSTTNKTDHLDITEILLKVALHTIKHHKIIIISVVYSFTNIIYSMVSFFTILILTIEFHFDSFQWYQCLIFDNFLCYFRTWFRWWCLMVCNATFNNIKFFCKA
jgi:hypothetical protein